MQQFCFLLGKFDESFEEPHRVTVKRHGENQRSSLLSCPSVCWSPSATACARWPFKGCSHERAWTRTQDRKKIPSFEVYWKGVTKIVSRHYSIIVGSFLQKIKSEYQTDYKVIATSLCVLRID